MKNIRFLTKDQPKKGTKDYHVFFEHNGVKLRLDWELSQQVLDESSLKGEDFNDHIAKLMLEQLRYDLEDDVLMDEIRAKNTPGSNDDTVQEWLDAGYQEEDAVEFKRLAQEKFGSE